MKRPTVLQIYPTGFHKKRDRVFAYGLKQNGNYMINIIENPQEEEKMLLNLLLILESISKPIYMYNGSAELSFLQKYVFNKEWGFNITDLYRLLNENQLFYHYTSKKLADVAKTHGFIGNVMLNEQLYLEFYPFKPSQYNSLEKQIQQNLDAIEKIAIAQEEIQKTIYGQSGNLPFTIEKIDKNHAHLSIKGKFHDKKNLYYHGESLFYEELQGKFDMEAQLIDIHYDQTRRIYALSYPLIRNNPLPMPEGYLLMGLNNIFYPEQIHQVLLDLHEEQFYTS